MMPTHRRPRRGKKAQRVGCAGLLLWLGLISLAVPSAAAHDLLVIPAIDTRIPKMPGFKRHDGADFEIQYPARWGQHPGPIPVRRMLHLYGSQDHTVALAVNELPDDDPALPPDEFDARKLTSTVAKLGKNKGQHLVSLLAGGTATKAGYAFTWTDPHGHTYDALTVFLITAEHRYSLALHFPKSRLSGRNASLILASFRPK